MPKLETFPDGAVEALGYEVCERVAIQMDQAWPLPADMYFQRLGLGDWRRRIEEHRDKVDEQEE